MSAQRDSFRLVLSPVAPAWFRQLWSNDEVQDFRDVLTARRLIARRRAQARRLIRLASRSVQTPHVS